MISAEEHINNIVNGILKYSRIKKNLTIICLTLAGIGVLFFILYGIFSSNQTIQFVADHKFDDKQLEKVMTNPRIKFEYKENQFYDIKAKSAIHKDGEDILLSDVFARGDSGTISAGKLLITENGNKLFFSENPVLVIKQLKTEPKDKETEPKDKVN